MRPVEDSSYVCRGIGGWHDRSGGGKLIDAAAKKAGEKVLSIAFGSQAVRKAAEEAAKRGTKTGLAILWANVKGLTLEPGKAVIEGNSIREGVLTGSLKTVGGIHGELLKYILINDEKYQKTAAFADTVISYGADKISEYLDEANKKSERPAAVKPPPKVPDAEDSQQALLDALAHDFMMIDHAAIRQIGTVDSFSAQSPSLTNSVCVALNLLASGKARVAIKAVRRLDYTALASRMTSSICGLRMSDGT